MYVYVCMSSSSSRCFSYHDGGRETKVERIVGRIQSQQEDDDEGRKEKNRWKATSHDLVWISSYQCHLFAFPAQFLKKKSPSQNKFPSPPLSLSLLPSAPPLPPFFFLLSMRLLFFSQRPLLNTSCLSGAVRNFATGLSPHCIHYYYCCCCCALAICYWSLHIYCSGRISFFPWTLLLA